MNYGECRDKALQLINQYTIAGSKIPKSYNNQVDYLLRIPGLINDAQMYIASSPKRILASLFCDKDTAEHDAHMYRFILPEDFMDIVPSGLLVVEPFETRRETNYTRMGDDYILVPDYIRGDIYLEYYRRPQVLPVNPPDDFPLDNTRAAQSAVPYYVASFLVMQDDAYVHQVLYGEWQNKLAQLYELPRPEHHIVHDAYDFAGWGDYC